MSNTIFQGAKKILGGFCPPGYGPGQSHDREASDTLSASAQFAPLPAETGCETC